MSIKYFEEEINYPQQTKKERVKNYIKWIIPGYNVYKSSVNLLSEYFGDYVRKKLGGWPAPELYKDVDKLREIKKQHLKENDICGYNVIKVIAPSGERIDTVEIVPNKINKDTVYVINFMGNSDCYENRLSFLKEHSIKTGYVNVAFNYPGVGESTGKANSSKVPIKAGILQVHRLLQKKIPPNNIILNGYSLGAGFATKVARYYHKKGIKINLFNDRSFSNVVHVYHQLILEKANTRLSRFKARIKAYILYVVSSIVVSAVNLKVNVGKDYNKIPYKNKDYIVVRSSKNDRKIKKDDETIPHLASIHYSEKQSRRKQKQSVDNVIFALRELNNKFFKKIYTPSIGERAIKILEKLELQFNDDKEEKIEYIKNAKNNLKLFIGKENIEHLNKSIQELLNLRKFIKFEHKLTKETDLVKSLFKEKEFVKETYNMCCNLCNLDKNNSIKTNLESLERKNDYFKPIVKVLRCFLLNEDIPNIKEIIEKDLNSHTLLKSMLVTRDESPHPIINGEEYFNKFIERTRKNKDSINSSKELINIS